MGDGDTAVTIAVGDNVNMGDEFDFANTASFTFEAWIYPTAISGSYDRIVTKKDPDDGSGAQGWLIWLHDLGSESSGAGLAIAAVGVEITVIGCTVMAVAVGSVTAGVGAVPTCIVHASLGVLFVGSGFFLIYQSVQPWEHAADTTSGGYE